MNTKILLTTLSLSLIAASNAFAGTAEDLEKVRHLARNKISGSDIKNVVSVYENTDMDPCMPEGTSYLVKSKLLKSEPKMLPNGEVGVQRKWHDIQLYVISREDLASGKDLSDFVCLE